MFALIALAAKVITDVTLAHTVLGITTGISLYNATKKARSSNSKNK